MDTVIEVVLIFYKTKIEYIAAADTCLLLKTFLLIFAWYTFFIATKNKVRSSPKCTEKTIFTNAAKNISTLLKRPQIKYILNM